MYSQQLNTSVGTAPLNPVVIYGPARGLIRNLLGKGIGIVETVSKRKRASDKRDELIGFLLLFRQPSRASAVLIVCLCAPRKGACRRDRPAWYSPRSCRFPAESAGIVDEAARAPVSDERGFPTQGVLPKKQKSEDHRQGHPPIDSIAHVCEPSIENRMKPKKKSATPNEEAPPELKERFCSVPFEQLVSHQNGMVQTCCQSWLPCTIGDLNKQTVEEVWNSPQMMLIRGSILNGSYSFCRKEICPFIVSKTLPLRSEVRDAQLRQVIDRNSVHLKRGPKILALTADRSCNLSCPSCRKEKLMLTSGPEFRKTRKIEREVLQKSLPGLEKLTVSGSGDPFASKIYREILTELDGRKYPKLKIQFLTNGQLLTPRMWKKIEKIHKNIEIIQVSLDAARPETYLILRRGGRMSPVLANLRFLVEQKLKGAKFILQLDFVVQKGNYREMPEFVALGKSLGVDKVYFQKMVNWFTFPKKEYLDRCVFHETHPEHAEFRKVMKDPLLEGSDGYSGEFNALSLIWSARGGEDRRGSLSSQVSYRVTSHCLFPVKDYRLIVMGTNFVANRKFGLLMASGRFGAIFLVRGLRLASWQPWSVVACAIFLSGALFKPLWLERPRQGWLFLGEIFGKVTQPVILGVFFYLVLTPIGIAWRRFGHPKIKIPKSPDAWKVSRSTFWNDSGETEPVSWDRLRRQF